MSEHDETASDSVSNNRSKLRPGKNPATIGAIATVLAAVIAGVFTLIASHGSGSGQPAGGVVTILESVGPGATGATAPSGPGGSGSDAFLADLTAVTSPNYTDYSDTVGGRTIIKTVGLDSGTEAVYTIPSSAKNFVASVGISDGNNGATDATGVFSVFGDTTQLGQVSLKIGQLAILSVSVKGYKVLRIAYSVAASDFLGKGDFGLARFTS